MPANAVTRRSGAEDMTAKHSCDWLKEVSADPRFPIKVDPVSGRYVLVINGDATVEMGFCPRCGENLCGSGKEIARDELLCMHPAELSRKKASSVRYRRREHEYWVFGSDSVKLRLFYCPICGSKLPLRMKDTHFYKKSRVEQSKLAKLFEDIKTTTQALERFGPADVHRGSFVDYEYPKGSRTRIGYKNLLFYDRLAKTITVCLIERLDGRISVRFYPKERKTLTEG